jgi:4-hydroxythreonine-4-phosphate dehydrogenase
MSKPAESIRPDPNAPIFVTMGEPAGIGPEIAVAAFRALGGRVNGHPLRLVGDPEIFRGIGAVPADALVDTGKRAMRAAGKPDPRNTGAVTAAIDTAVKACLKGEAAALVTAPVHKAALMHAGFAYPGHTEYLEHLTKAPRAVMMLAGKGLRVVPVTIHIALKSVPGALTRDAIVDTGRIVLDALARDFGIARPRLAVAGLNPHAGEDGEIGREDKDLIAPAIAELKRSGATILGPLPADTLFHEEARAKYDAALCMYHDQALIPIKTLAFWEGVNVTLGLPIVRTSPDHGTALDIAGQGKADARSMIAAIELAAEMADARGR